MKSIRLLLLAFCLFGSLWSMEGSPEEDDLPPGTITLICSDGTKIYMKRSVAEYSGALNDTLCDTKVAPEESTIIPLSIDEATKPIVNSFALGMQMIACYLPQGGIAKPHKIIPTLIHDLSNLIIDCLGISTMDERQRQQTIGQLFSVEGYLNIPIFHKAIACIAASHQAKYSSWMPECFFGGCDEEWPDTKKPIRQAKQFLRINTKSFFGEEEIAFQSPQDLFDWGFAPFIGLPGTIKSIDDYIVYLVHNKHFVTLQEFIDSFSLQGYDTLSQHVTNVLLDCIHNVINDAIVKKEFIALQKVLENFVTNSQIELAQIAYKALFCYIKKMQFNEIDELYKEPLLGECALKVTLRIAALQEHLIALDPSFTRIKNWRNLVRSGVDLKYILPLLDYALKKPLHINIPNAQLQQIPSEICLASFLRSIDLSSNQISDVPETICLCRGLKSLDLSHNQLSIVPETIFQIKTLEELSLAGNNITMLPDELASLPRLKTIYLDRTVEIPTAFMDRPGIKFKFWDTGLQRWVG